METTALPTFGTLLRRYRRAAGLTQEELAERAAISLRSLGDLERGVPHVPRKDTVALLAGALALVPRDQRAFLAAAHRLAAPAQVAATTDAASTSPFVGRARELAVLRRHLAGEGPPVLLLAGEPGIGKSRLLRAALPRAVARGWRVLEGGCQRSGGQQPYAPLLAALQRHIRGQRPGQVRVDLQGCAWLVRLLPELADGPIPPLPSWILPPAQERRLMAEAVIRFLANVAGPAGTLLILDDLQWADPDALELLATLARSAPDVPLRVIGAYRITEVQPEDPLTVMLADLGHAGLAARRLLHPLAPAETAQLLDALLDDVPSVGMALRDAVVQRAGGVPFFVVSCARGLRLGEVDGARALPTAGGNVVPWDVAQSVRQRVAALPAAARELLGTAAVVGRVAPRDLLVAMATRPTEEVLGAFDAACEARLLEETADDAYQFAHDVIREVVVGDLGAARRRVMHRQVAEALERRPGEPPVEVLAYHYTHSDAHDKAVLYLEEAGDRALAQHANAAAEGHYRQAVAVLDRLGRVHEAARVHEKLGAVLMTLARYDGALAELERAMATQHAVADLESLGRVTAQIGWAYAQKGAPEEGVARLQTLLESLAGRGSPQIRARLYVALARLFVVSGRPGDELAAAAWAVELAAAVGDDQLLAEATGRHGLALLHTGHMDEGLRILEEARGRAEATGDLFSLCRALINAVKNGYIHRGEFALCRQYLDHALEVAERYGDPAQIASALSTRGMTAFYTGEWAQARVEVECAVAMSRAIGVSWVLQETLLDLEEVCLRTGAWDEALRCRQEAQAPHASVEYLLLQGRPTEALAQLTPLLDDLCPEHVRGPGTLTCLAWAHLDLGDLDLAADAVARAISSARKGDNRLTLIDALRIQALVAIRQRRWDDAAQALADGLSLARRMPYPYAEGRLLHVSGEMHTQKDEHQLAWERLEDALAIFQHLGARKDMEQLEQTRAALRSSGERPR